MKEGQYWLITLKAEDFWGAQPFDGTPVARIIALTPTREQPTFTAVIDGIMDGLRIGRRGSTAFSYNIYPFFPDKVLLDKLPSLLKWAGKDLKLWVASRSRDA
jgi:hypothetical protein